MKASYLLGKQFAGATLFSSAASYKYLQSLNKINECADAPPSQGAQKEAEDLEKIFQEGGPMMDQKEIMELMMNRGNNTLKPYPYEKIVQYTAIFKQESCDGLNLNVSFPFGNNFQVQGQWMLSNTKGASFEMSSSVNSSNGNPYQNQEEVSQAMFRFASDQTGMVFGGFQLPYGIQCQTQIMFQDPELQQVINVVNLQKDFDDCSAKLTYQAAQGQGVFSVTYMQSLCKAMQAGLQTTYVPQMPSNNFQFGYCAFYQIGDKQQHQFAAAYSPANPREVLNLSYVGKPSQRLQLFTDLKGSSSTSEFLAGFRLKFLEGSITGYMNSHMKFFATYAKQLEGGAMRLEFNTQMDFKSTRNPCLFGLNLNIGMM